MKLESKTMQTRKDDLAFPIFDADGQTVSRATAGLTKLEYFAAKALQGILSNSELVNSDNYRPKDIAALSIEAAKLLIYELNQEDMKNQNSLFKNNENE